jgi:hypothetical protein
VGDGTMSYYNYQDDYYTTYLDLGVAGEQEVEVCVDIEIDYQDIMREMGDDVWDYIDDSDVAKRVIDNHTDYMQGIVEDACTGGLQDLVECLVQRYKECGEEEELQMMVKAATKAIHELNDVEQGELI